MSRRESQVDTTLLHTDYSSGDSNKMNPKTCQEENNNDIEQLSKDLSAMGCIVDAVKKPANTCIEHCIHEESDSEEQNNTVINNEEDGYSDEFEDDKSDDEAVKEVDLEDDTHVDDLKRTTLTLIKSQSSTSTNKPPLSVAGSGRSSYGSLPVPKTNRINMSFSNDRLREIERHNHILLNKIICARNVRKSSIPPHGAAAACVKPVSSAAVMRRHAQRQIDHDNMILLKKLQRTKSSSCSIRR